MNLRVQMFCWSWNFMNEKRTDQRLGKGIPNARIRQIKFVSIRNVAIGVLLYSAISITAVAAQTRALPPQPASAPTSATRPLGAAPAVTSTPAQQAPEASALTRFQSNRPPSHVAAYYGVVWGIESLSVKVVESGEMIRFSFRVLDPVKAKPLNDKNFEPSLIDPQAGVKLVVPALEQVGILRQTSVPEAGKSYWMGFSNSGRMVKRGDRVNVVIGQFHADGIVVE
jgi:hypothetical protein